MARGKSVVASARAAIVIAGVGVAVLVSGADDYADPQARPIFTDGNFRFTAITDRLIRVEYDEEKIFLNDPTVTFMRGKLEGHWEYIAKGTSASVIQTSKVSLTYRHGNLSTGSVSIKSLEDGSHLWSYGDDPEPGNLRGTVRTLDNNAETVDLNCHHKVSPVMDNSEEHCVFGLVSRRGWAVIDDTGAPVRRNDWFAPSRNHTDISVFMHGFDFTGALLDFFKAAGPPSLPPRYALGTMFTRWFAYDEDSVSEVVDEFESRAMPMDAWVFDMNWHTYGPWGSFTWNTNLFPKVQKMLDWFRSRDLFVGANLHEHDGITQKEATYQEVCKFLRRVPGVDLPFDLYNKSYADAQENISIRALATKDDQQGLDFYWIDYQQGETNTFQNTTIPNLNPTIVLNTIRSEGFTRHGEDRRSLIVSRWGGLGSHRYPVGFSGDQNHDWKALAFLPYFTSTAANVAFNYWSHDTVGGAADTSSDHELSTRWVQTIAWSPVLRFHDKGAGTGDCATNGVCARIMPWDVPSPYFRAIRGVAQEREELLPYIYTAAAMTGHTGLALVRPMYYENPKDDKLYDLGSQYLFGPDMVVSPITVPSGDQTKGFREALGAVSWSIFAPKCVAGWVHRLDGDFHNDEQVTGIYGIRDVPSLARQGAVIPMRPRERGESSIGQARKSFSSLEFRIMPAEAFYEGIPWTGMAQVFDDDGMTHQYAHGKQATTTLHYSFEKGMFKIWLSQRGDFQGRPSEVTLRLSFPQLPPLKLLKVSGITLAAQDYEHRIIGSVFRFDKVDLKSAPYFEVAIDDAYGAVLKNFVGLLGKVRRCRYVKDALDSLNTPYGADRSALTSLVLAATEMDPHFIAGLPDLWTTARSQVRTLLTQGALAKDQRRREFVTKMLELSPDLSEDVHQDSYSKVINMFI